MSFRSKTSLTATLAALALAACAHSYQPVIDTKGVDMRRYQQDLAECQNYADQVNPVEDAGVDALVGAVGGAALGAATGAIVGAPAYGAATGAAVGGIGGAGYGGVKGVEKQKSIINKCLSGRGYKVLG